MGRYFNLVLVALGTCVGTAIASELPEAAKRYIEINYPGYTVDASTSAVGDIDGDGIPDVAVVCHSRNTKADYHAKLFVLRGSHGSFSLLAASKNSSAPQHGAELEIRGRSLYINKFHSGDGTMNNFYQSQFQYRNARLVLIGTEETHEATSQPPRGDPYMDTSVSTNFLTRVVITTNKRKGKIVKTSKTRLSPAQLTALDDYEI